MGAVIRIFTTEGTESTEDGEERVFGSGIRNSSASVPSVFSALSVVNLVLALNCTGCAASASTTNRGGAAAAPAVVALVPSGAAAEFYATEVMVGVSTDPFVGRLAAEVDESGKRHGHAPIIRDGRLDRVAADIARATDALRAPPPDAVAFLLSHYGLVEPEPNLFLVRGDDGAEASAAAGLREQLASAVSSAWRRVGIGVWRTTEKWSAVLVLQEKNIDIEPVSRRFSSGGHANIAGRIRPIFHSPEVLFTPPWGEVERLATSTTRDTFAARFDCNRGDGAYQIEINAVDARGPRVLANFPVYCGIAPPTTFTVPESTASRTVDPALAEAQLLDQLDRDRKAHGLPALVHDPRLAQIARRYSREMAETGEVAHYSRRSGRTEDRVLAAGISPAPTFIGENVGSALTAADAEHGFMASPGHRDNILNRALTHVGVGVAVGREDGGMVPLYFTQVFAGWGQ